MNSLIATAISVDGKRKVEIHIDEDCGSPREWDNLGVMCCWHKRYSLGDADSTSDFDIDEYDSFDAMIEGEFGEKDVVLPLYMYDHSGITISTSPFGCGWDSGQLGFIYVRAETIKKEYGDLSDESLRKAKAVLQAEVEEYDQYVRGNCYGYLEMTKSDKCECCGHWDWEDGDSCWGFIGDWESIFKNEIDGFESMKLSYE